MPHINSDGSVSLPVGGISIREAAVPVEEVDEIDIAAVDDESTSSNSMNDGISDLLDDLSDDVDGDTDEDSKDALLDISKDVELVTLILRRVFENMIAKRKKLITDSSKC